MGGLNTRDEDAFGRRQDPLSHLDLRPRSGDSSKVHGPLLGPPLPLASGGVAVLCHDSCGGRYFLVFASGIVIKRNPGNSTLEKAAKGKFTKQETFRGYLRTVVGMKCKNTGPWETGSKRTPSSQVPPPCVSAPVTTRGSRFSPLPAGPPGFLPRATSRAGPGSTPPSGRPTEARSDQATVPLRPAGAARCGGDKPEALGVRQAPGPPCHLSPLPV